MTLPTLDASFEDNPHLHSLRIPPLQHPFHAPSIVSKRPPPLEPNARVNIDKEANKLTGRQRALAEAKPLGVSDSIDIEAPVPAKTMREFGDNSERSSERPRKKQKLCDNDQVADFVQLPKPQAKVTDAKPRPFQPISVLNELHEPPPSAALFPPITPSVNQEEHDSSCSARQLSNSAQDHARRSRKSSTGSSNAKRNYTRERTLWTQDETECLVKGVAIYGMGKWKKILDHPELHFLEGRTNTDLKDRFRVLFPPNAPHKWVRPKPKPPVDYHGAPPSSTTITRTSNKAPGARQRARKHKWTEFEDAELDKGFKIYGFQWNLMRKDPNLHFDGRSYGQLRDRFRLRFPNIYKQQDGTASPAEGMETHVPRPKLQSEKLPKPKKGVLNDSIESVKSDDSDVGAREKTTSKATVAPSSYTAGGLNGEDEDIRLSNSILHNGWDWDDNVTLAPLAWEDIATRPIFGFD